MLRKSLFAVVVAAPLLCIMWSSPAKAQSEDLTLDWEAVGADPANPECCIFSFRVTNNTDHEVCRIYLDLEAGSGGPCTPDDPSTPVYEPVLDVSLGWEWWFCYEWDGAVPSNWAIVASHPHAPCFDPGDTVSGTLRVKVNGPLPAPIFGGPHMVPPDAIHAHVTASQPDPDESACALGLFGPHGGLAGDWSPGSDWICPGFIPAASQWGLGALALLLLGSIAIKFGRRRAA